MQPLPDVWCGASAAFLLRPRRSQFLLTVAWKHGADLPVTSECSMVLAAAGSLARFATTGRLTAVSFTPCKLDPNYPGLGLAILPVR